MLGRLPFGWKYDPYLCQTALARVFRGMLPAGVPLGEYLDDFLLVFTGPEVLDGAGGRALDAVVRVLDAHSGCETVCCGLFMCSSSTFGMATGVALPVAAAAFRFSLPYLRVMSTPTRSCRTVIALDCSGS